MEEKGPRVGLGYKSDAAEIPDSYPGSCFPKSTRTTDDNITVLQSERRSYDPVLCGALHRIVHFNYIKFAAEYLL